MTKKSVIRQVAYEIAEIGKDVAKGVKEEVMEKGAKEAVESLTGVKVGDESKIREKEKLRELAKEDDKTRGPQIAEQRRLIAAMNEEEKRISFERARQLQQTEEEKLPLKPKTMQAVTVRGREKRSLLPFRKKATTNISDSVPDSIEKSKRNIA